MSSGEDCDLQIDVGKVEENPKKKEKKQQRGSASKEGGRGGQGEGWKPGDLVWAKVSGFNHWPGKVGPRNSPKWWPTVLFPDHSYLHPQEKVVWRY